LVVINFLAVFGGIAFSSDTLKSGQNAFHYSLANGIVVNLLIVVEPHQSNSSSKFSPYSIWGAVDSPPKQVVRQFCIRINSESVSLIESSYTDLGEPREISAFLKDKDVWVELVGSDAGGGYLCQWHFRYSKGLESFVLEERIVHLMEFPQVSEKTTFTYNERTDL